MQSTSDKEGSGPRDPAATSSVTMGAMLRPGLPVQTHDSDGTPSPCQDEEAITSILATSIRLEARLNELRTWLSSSAASEQSHGPCDCSSLREGVNSHMSQISSLTEQIQREAIDLKHRSQASKRHRETSADAAKQRQDTAVDIRVQGRMDRHPCDKSKAVSWQHLMTHTKLLKSIINLSRIFTTDIIPGCRRPSASHDPSLGAELPINMAIPLIELECLRMCFVSRNVNDGLLRNIWKLDIGTVFEELDL